MIKILFFIILFSSYSNASEIKTNWYKSYPKIENIEAKEYLNDGIRYSIKQFGNPNIYINQVNLRLSKPLEKNLRSNFQICEITDSKEGIFTIYLSRLPSEYAFYGQLGHEIFHLLNAKISDAYVEGLSTVFSEMLIIKNGKNWSRWLQYYQAGNEPFYANSYFMMKKIVSIVGIDNMHNFLSYTVYKDNREETMYLDINSWLKTLSLIKQTKVIEVIDLYSKEIIDSKKENVVFILPNI